MHKTLLLQLKAPLINTDNHAFLLLIIRRRCTDGSEWALHEAQGSTRLLKIKGRLLPGPQHWWGLAPVNAFRGINVQSPKCAGLGRALGPGKLGGSVKP